MPLQNLFHRGIQGDFKMSLEYTAHCTVEWDEDSRFLAVEFFRWLKNQGTDIGLYNLVENQGTFNLSQSRGIDFTHIEAKLKQMHRAHPDLWFEFDSNVMVETEDNFYFNFSDEEIDDDDLEEGEGQEE